MFRDQEGPRCRLHRNAQLKILFCRSAKCADRLTTSFPAPGNHVKTLYDNFEYTLNAHPEVHDVLSPPVRHGARKCNTPNAEDDVIADTLFGPEAC